MVTRSLFSFRQSGRQIERVGYVIGAVLLASGLVHAAVLIVGGGSWEGPVSLRKAATFGLSFGLTLITVAWVTSFLQMTDRRRAQLLGVFTGACVFETALVTLQAWRGVPSHFNLETAFDGLVARGLAAGGFTLVAIIVALTFVAFRPNPQAPVSMRAAIRFGFVTLCAAMAVGAAMIAKGMLLVFAGNPQAAYTTGGWLKPTHAVTMHAILVLPALAWLLSLVDWSEERRLRTVIVACVAYAAIVAIVAAENIAG